MPQIQRVGYGHPDALRLIDEVQAEYVVRYGGPDETPLDPLMFEPPAGSFFVGYVEGEPVATGAWRRTNVVALGTDATRPRSSGCTSRPRARGRGLARLMLAHLEAARQEHGAEAVVLETGLRQPEAIGALRVQRLRADPAVRLLQGRAAVALLRQALPAPADHEVALVGDRPAPVRRVVEGPVLGVEPGALDQVDGPRRRQPGAGRPASLDQHQPAVGRRAAGPASRSRPPGRAAPRARGGTARRRTRPRAAAGRRRRRRRSWSPGTYPTFALARRTISGEKSTPSTRTPPRRAAARACRCRSRGRRPGPGSGGSSETQQAPPGVAHQRVVQAVVRLVVERRRLGVPQLALPRGHPDPALGWCACCSPPRSPTASPTAR